MSALLDERAIKDLPLNGRRFTDLLLLVPGVTQDPRGLTSGSNGDLSYGGIRGYNTSFLVDGDDNNNGFFAQAMGRYRAPYQFSDEVVQEFRVQSSGYGAESGRAGGAVVNVVTKSGTNQWHGSTFYYLRDSSLGGAAPAFVGFNPSDQQHQFGATIGGPIQRNKTFIFAGYDQQIFHVPAVVEFENGSTSVGGAADLGYTQSVPGITRSAIRDWRAMACDQALVFRRRRQQLSTMGGTFPAKLLGNTGFVKLDRVLTPHQHLSARLSTSRYYGTNNVFLDPASPITNDAISGNGEEDVKTESGSLALLSEITPRLTSHLRAQFSRDLEQSFPNTTGTRTSIYDWLQDFGQSSILPRQTREHRLHLAETLSLSRGRNQWKFGGDTMRTWDYNYFPSLYGGEYLFGNIVVNPFTFVPMHGGLADAAAGVRAANAAGIGMRQLDWNAAALLHPEFRQSRIASGQQRLRGVRAGHGAADATFHLEHGSALRFADVFKDGDGQQSAVATGGEDAPARDEFRAAGGNRVCDRRRSSPDGAGRIRNFLYPHSADL